MHYKNKSLGRIAFLVVSCDSYSDVWDIFFHNLSKYWKDCPFDIYLQTNFKDFQSNLNIKTLKTGKDKSWSDGLIKSLNSLQDYEYVFLALEDFIIKDYINNEAIISVVEKFLSIKGNFLTLINEPKPDKQFNAEFGEISAGAMYRTTATFSLWNKKTLLHLLDPTENAWEFEKVGSQRSKFYSGFYAVHHDYIPFLNTIIKGKWTQEALQYFRQFNIMFNESRAKMSVFEWHKHKLYIVIRKLILKFTPFRLRKKLIRNK